MYIIPFSMGPVGSPLAKIGIEVTDSIYVVLNMAIMTRVGQKVLDVLGDSDDWVRGLHAKCDVDRGKALYLPVPGGQHHHLRQLRVTAATCCWAKSALRCASRPTRAGKRAGWPSICSSSALQNPKGEVKYIAAAFPSACGKTNLAMLIPPEYLREKGYKVWTVGDDIAWMRIGADGRLYAINPENGFFGVAPGTNAQSNLNALKSTKKNTIFTNVAHQSGRQHRVVGRPGQGICRTSCIDWKGNPWKSSQFVKADKSTYAAHPNSRFTAPADELPVHFRRVRQRRGRADFGDYLRRPPCQDALRWCTSPATGRTACSLAPSMASETTAAAAGAVGVVRRDPMAMLPFCGYNMGDYFAHWLEMGKKLGDKAPKIFNVNWFRTDDEGHFIWPGFGDNMRVLNWIIDRCEGKADATETAIGYVPKPEDIDLTGLDMDMDTLKGILTVDHDVWVQEANEIEEHYKKFGDKLPKELRHQLDTLKKNLGM